MSFNPVIPWRELDSSLSWGKHGELARGKGGKGARPAAQQLPAAGLVPYAELHCHSSFSFQDGASDPDALAAEAARLGLEALAITDHDGLYGAVRLAEAARVVGLKTVFGAELSLGADRSERTGMPDPPGAHLLLLARDLDGYRALSRAIGAARLAGSGKGRAVYDLDELAGRAAGRWAVLTGCRKGLVPAALARGGMEQAGTQLRRLQALFGPENVFVELVDHDAPADDARNDALARLAEAHRAPTVATNNVHYATPGDFPTAAALAALRARLPLADIEGWLPAGPTAHLRSGEEMAARFARFPGILGRTVELARACAVDFGTVAPGLPRTRVPDEHDDPSWLRELVLAGAARRYGPRREHARAYRQLDYELGVIAKQELAGYFLIVHEITTFCREQDILVQGRGSAANSAVCYALGITGADPVQYNLVFERFLSPEREGYPDIDLDIESGRREEVIQHVYQVYGRENSAQVANVITYRPKLALRDAARALGYSPGAQDSFLANQGPYSPLPRARPRRGSEPGGPARPVAEKAEKPEKAEKAEKAEKPEQTPGEDPGIPADVLDLAGRLLNLPRHLGIHSGGMIIADRPIGEVCPTEWARMENRSVVQWDKDDCADAGLVKFDLLGLGMLGALHECFDLVRAHHGVALGLGEVPTEDPRVYDMLCAADSVGVFQVESRAQMATLPRLKPREFYDLVVEVALIRPGPIQGGAVHPYLRRRSGQEPADPPHPLLAEALHRTLGVPLFQEQVMQMAVAAAGFSPAEADALRRAMGSKRSTARMLALRQRLISGMAANDITGDLAEDIYHKLQAFSSYGFPEAHSISFAYLVYVSSYLKFHYPAAFTAALLNNQPMGFYAPSTLINDARHHDVQILGPDVNASAVGAALEAATRPYRRRHEFAAPLPQPAIRTGLAPVTALGRDAAERIVAERAEEGPFRDLEDFVRRTGIARAGLESLATAGAFGSFGLTRRQALWQAGSLAGTTRGQLPGTSGAGRTPDLPPMTAVEQTFADLWSTGSSPDSHPIGHVRGQLAAAGFVTAADLARVPDRRLVRIAGVVTHRQRPPTAGGVCFLSLEDETGLVNVVCPPAVWERYQKVALAYGALLVTGSLERSDHGGGALNVVAGRLAPLRAAGQPERTRRRDFR
ncbi:MAG TPA: DNA polymerase III subunit alpha [Actinocrinis sp.]|nr:DNA polymerase III subunit alpha [Actinocrinis sp.]